MSAFFKSRLVRTGLPFFAFVIGGSYFLREFATVRYEFRKGKKLSREEVESMGLTTDVKKVTGEVLKDIQHGKVDTWENIRGPRPWEDSKTYQTEERQRLALEKEKER